MIVIDNAPRGTKPPAPVLKDNGELYNFRCHFNADANIAFADSLEEFLPLFIRGYDEMSEEDKDLARLSYLRGQRTLLAANVLASVESDQISEEDYTVLAHNSPSGWGTDGIDLWDSTLPLFLIAQDYAPYTDKPRPLSAFGDAEVTPNLVWLDALNEETFLESLHSVGLITISQSR